MSCEACDGGGASGCGGGGKAVTGGKGDWKKSGCGCCWVSRTGEGIPPIWATLDFEQWINYFSPS